MAGADRVAAYVRGESGGACPLPREVKVREEVYVVPCGSRYCAVCGRRWEQDQRVRAVAAAEHLSGGVALLTVTAPGSAWFTSAADDRGGTRREEVRWWNATARARWRSLHLRASKQARRWAALHGCRWRLLYRAWEYQKRGLLHLHAVLPWSSWVERTATRRYVRAVWALARSEGFGFVLGGDEGEAPSWERPPRIKPADAAAATRYVAKYVASTGRGKEGMASVAKRTACRGSVLYISPSLTKLSGVTMTSLRARRRIHARYPWASTSGQAWRAARMIDAVQRGRPPLTDEAQAAIRALSQDRGATLWVEVGDGEIRSPTPAPVPLSVPRELPRPPDATRVAVLGLASVRLADPRAPWLGGVRTVLRRVELVQLPTIS